MTSIAEWLIGLSSGTSLVVQWLRILLPMQGTRVQSLVQHPTCHGASKTVPQLERNLCAVTKDPMCCN